MKFPTYLTSGYINNYSCTQILQIRSTEGDLSGGEVMILLSE